MSAPGGMCPNGAAAAHIRAVDLHHEEYADRRHELLGRGNDRKWVYGARRKILGPRLEELGEQLMR